jgi:hypothetical protein
MPVMSRPQRDVPLPRENNSVFKLHRTALFEKKSKYPVSPGTMPPHKTTPICADPTIG